MPFSPRGNETKAVLDLLESDEFDSAEKMAKAIVSAVAGQLAQRRTFIIVPKGAAFGYGPYWSEADAGKAWREEIGSSFSGTAALLGANPWAPKDEIVPGCACSHQKEQHVLRGKNNTPSECSVCECRSYTKRTLSDG